MPGLPAGRLLTRSGRIMASEDNFSIHVQGRGGHASAPHLLVDPLDIAAEIVTALQHVVARNVDPVATAVVSCTDLRTDGARNAIPSDVHITGDTRNSDCTVQTLLEQRIRALSTGIAAAHGATAEVSYTHEFMPTVNDADCADRAAHAARTALGPEQVSGDCEPVMASEDLASSPTTCPRAWPSWATAPSRAGAAPRCTATTR